MCRDWSTPRSRAPCIRSAAFSDILVTSGMKSDAAISWEHSTERTRTLPAAAAAMRVDRASRAPSRPKQSERIAGRARAPRTALRRPAPPRWEAPANCRRQSRGTFTARVSSRFPPSSVRCQVGTYAGAGPSRNNVEQCSGVMVVQPSGVYCCSIRGSWVI